MGNEPGDSSYSRRQWMGLAALGGVTAVAAGPRKATSEPTPGPHRLALSAGDLEALVVDNHDGLAGEEQKHSRASVPQVAGGLGRLTVAVLSKGTATVRRPSPPATWGTEARL